MKSFILAILATGLVFTTHAQKNVTELWPTVNNPGKADTARINALYRIIVLIPYEQVNDSTLIHAKKAGAWAASSHDELAGIAADYVQAYFYMRKNNAEKSEAIISGYFSQLKDLSAKKTGDETVNILIANTWVVSAINHKNKQEPTAALGDYLEAYPWAAKTRFKKITGSILGAVSSAYLYSGEYTKALDYNEKSIAAYQEAGYTKGIMQAINSGANILNNMGDQPGAIEKYSLAMDMASELGDKRSKAMYISNLAGIYSDLGNNEKALSHYLSALETATGINDRSMMAVIYGNLSMVYYNQMDALKMSQGNTDSIETVKKRMVNAAEKNVEIREKISDINFLGNAYNSLSQVYFYSDQYDKAILYAQKSKEVATRVGNPAQISTANNSLSSYYLAKNMLDSAGQHALVALEQAKEIKYMRQVILAWNLLYQIKQKQNDQASSEKYATDLLNYDNKVLASNFAILSEKEKELYFETLLPHYDGFNQIALIRKKENPVITGKVYDTAIKNKGLLLKSSTAMRNAILTGKDTALVTAYNKWTGLKKEISNAYESGEDISQLEEQSNALEKELVKRSQVFSDFDRIQNIHWKDVQKGLKKGEAAIEFIRFNNSLECENTVNNIYCALVVKPESLYPEMIELCSEALLQQILGSFGGNNLNYINGIYTKNSEKNEALYDLIWKPIEVSLGKTKSVYISPSGLLHRVSFAAISKSKNVYLCDNYNISIQSSTARVANPENAVFTRDMATSVFGGIDYGSDKSETTVWQYLEGTKSEASEITGLLKKNRLAVDFYTSADATEEILKSKAAGSDVLHIATHGFFFPDPSKVIHQTTQQVTTGNVIFRGSSKGFGVENFVENKNPLMRSGLAFAHANEVWDQAKKNKADDGVLTAQEVVQLDMRHTQLVVLSACETGLGDIRGSEGVYGLQRAFKMAGVKFLIMSLWQVPDKETGEFMVTFYKKMIGTGNIRQAFMDTQKEMRKKYSPYYWAAFELLE